jgi:hypothetical protein
LIAAIDEYLHQFRGYVNETGDGNCGFYGLLRLIFGDNFVTQVNAILLRHVATEQMLGDPIYYTNPIVGVEQLGFQADPVEALALHITRMRNTNESLEGTMLRALLQYFGIRIEIHGMFVGIEVGIQYVIQLAFHNCRIAARTL